MGRIAKLAAVLAAVVVALTTVVAHPAGAAEGSPGAGTDVAAAEQVLIVSMPTLRWSDVVELEPPNLSRLVRRSAVASMSLRTVGSVPDIGRSYATIGAGNRATTRLWNDGQFYPPGATYEGGDAGSVFERRCACEIADSAAVHVGIAQLHLVNEALLYDAVPGALGQALRDGGRTAAAIGNADDALVANADAAHREVGLAVMDQAGRVQRGAVGPQLLVDDPAAPFGVRMDLDATKEAFDAVWPDTDVVALEMSDLARVDRYAPVSMPEAYREARAEAVADADELLGAVLEQVDLERDLVIVLSPSDPSPPPVELGIAVVSGPGFEPGLARSGRTRRDGYVTLPDVAPTILGALGLPLPSSMTGSILLGRSGGGAPDAEMLAGFVDDNAIDVFRNRVIGSVTVAYILIQILTYGSAVAALSTRRPLWRRLAGFLALVTMSMPAVAFLSGLVDYAELGTGGYVAAFLLASAAVATLAWLATLATRLAGPGRRRDVPPVAAPVLVAGLILVVLLVDIATGGRLQINTVWGYVATVAGRFAGFGNLAFGLVSIAAIVFGTGLWRLVRKPGGPGAETSRTRELVALTIVGVIFTVTVLAIGLPQLGSDVGGVLASVPAFVLTILLLRRVTLTWKRIALVALSTVVVLGLFGLVDLSRPEGSRTHLGRTLALFVDGGPEQLVTIIQRKSAANLNILTSSAMALLIPVALAFLCFLAWRRPGFLRQIEAGVAGSRSCIIGGLVVGVLAALLNDSGVAIPAMMFGVLLPYLTVLLLRTVDTS